MASALPRFDSVQVTFAVCPGRNTDGATTYGSSYNVRSAAPRTTSDTTVSPVLAASADVLAATPSSSLVGASSLGGVNTRSVTVAVSSGARKKFALSGSGLSG